MKLSDRLRLHDAGGAPAAAPAHDEDPAAAPAGRTAAAEQPPLHGHGPSAAANAALPVAPSGAATVDALLAFKERVRDTLYGRLGSRLYDAELDETQLRALVKQELTSVLDDEPTPLSSVERAELTSSVCDDVLGYGPIERHLADPSVTEIMVNGTSAIYVEQHGRLRRTDSTFVSDGHLRRVIERIVGRVGRRIDESSPMVDARLPDGSRVNAIVPPLAVDGPSLTIRKFSEERWGPADLVRFGTMTEGMAELLATCVAGRLNVLVTGGTGTGKTTMLNVLSSFIPEAERIVTIEDAVELQLQQDNLVRLESRPANIEGRGEVEIRDLLRNALRMRPDRIIVGEVRGGEALDMLQAMNTGHDGSLCTVHANSPRDAIARIETMVLMAGMDLPARAIREQVASALDLIVHVTRLRDGSRRVTHVTEVVGMEGQVVTLQDVFLFDYGAGVDEEGRFRGGAAPTGIRPKFLDRLADYGLTVSSEVFGVPVLSSAGAR